MARGMDSKVDLSDQKTNVSPQFPFLKILKGFGFVLIQKKKNK